VILDQYGCYNRCHGNTVKGILTLWDSTCGCVSAAIDIPTILDGNFLVKAYIYEVECEGMDRIETWSDWVPIM
jgi:hypothetical protein